MVSQGGNWVEKWEVPSSDGKSTYIVSRDSNGDFGCSCPQWKFRRQRCKHVAMIEYRLQCEQDDTAIRQIKGSPAKLRKEKELEPTLPFATTRRFDL